MRAKTWNIIFTTEITSVKCKKTTKVVLRAISSWYFVDFLTILTVEQLSLVTQNTLCIIKTPDHVFKILLSERLFLCFVLTFIKIKNTLLKFPYDARVFFLGSSVT
jgi:hypothetical protein